MNLKVRTPMKFVMFQSSYEENMLRKKTANNLTMMKRLPAAFGAVAKKYSKKKMKSNQILIKKHVIRFFKMFSYSVIPTKYSSYQLG